MSNNQDILTGVFESHRENLVAIESIMRQAMVVAEQVIEDAGMKVKDFHICAEFITVLSASMDSMLEENYIFNVLEKQIPNGLIFVAVNTECNENNQMGFCATIYRSHNGTVRPEMYDMEHNAWTIHYAYEEGQIAPVNCDFCEHRDECDKYDELLQMEDQYEFIKSMSDDGVDFEEESNDFYDGLPAFCQEILDKNNAEAALLETYLGYSDIPTKSQWQSFKKKHNLLLKLMNQTGKILIPDFVEDDVVLLHGDELHYGFLIRQNKDVLELCQYIDEDMLLQACGNNPVGYSVASFDKPYILTVASSKDINSFVHFVQTYLNRYNEEDDIYTIPLSLDKALFLKGAIGKRLNYTKRQSEKYLSSCNEKEIHAAEQFFNAFEKRKKGVFAL